MSTKPSDFDRDPGGKEPAALLAHALVGATPVASLSDLDRFAADIWESAAKLETFLADVRAARAAELA
ncbi:MAG TPA: hypothetical protein VNG13_04875 [Mycobacteriales bacterium]|nr:hypothetical protein [Mycobacteriales bacterium]